MGLRFSKRGVWCAGKCKIKILFEPADELADHRLFRGDIFVFLVRNIADNSHLRKKPENPVNKGI